MTKTLLSCLVVALLGALLAGCLVRTRDHHHHHGRRDVRHPSCHPSQYWDGRTCRAKGNSGHKHRHR